MKNSTFELGLHFSVACVGFLKIFDRISVWDSRLACDPFVTRLASLLESVKEILFVWIIVHITRMGFR